MKYTIDAKNKSIGRIATDIAHKLQGKDSAAYNPRLPGVSEVEVVNADKVKITGNKSTTKVYKWHTGYVGNLKERKLKDALARDPAWVLRRAVYNMLPKNRLRKGRMARLSVKTSE